MHNGANNIRLHCYAISDDEDKQVTFELYYGLGFCEWSIPEGHGQFSLMLH